MAASASLSPFQHPKHTVSVTYWTAPVGKMIGNRMRTHQTSTGKTTRSSRFNPGISLDKTSKGIFRRLAEITPFASHTPAVRVAWDDSSRDQTGVVPRSVAVDLPSELSDGRYRLTVTIEGSTGQRIERIIELVVRTP